MSTLDRPPIPLATLIEVLDEFHERFPRPGLGPFMLSEPYFVEEDWTDRTKSVPHAPLPGVYFLFNPSDDLLYVGKSEVGLGRRVGGRFTTNPDGSKRGMVVDPVHRAAGVVSVRAIAVPKQRWFEVGSIEAWLIDRLKPPLNDLGTYRVRADDAQGDWHE